MDYIRITSVSHLRAAREFTNSRQDISPAGVTCLLSTMSEREHNHYYLIEGHLVNRFILGMIVCSCISNFPRADTPPRKERSPVVDQLPHQTAVMITCEFNHFDEGLPPTLQLARALWQPSPVFPSKARLDRQGPIQLQACFHGPDHQHSRSHFQPADS